MRPGFRLYIASVTGGAVIVGLLAVAFAPLWSSIGGPEGLLFWIVVVTLSSSSSVRMPGGTIVDVSTAPLLACAVLGGPAAAAIAAAVGTFEVRELRGLVPGSHGGVPWYGSAYNHSAALIPAVVAAVAIAASAFVASSYTNEALFAVGACALFLLFIGIHNAWDSVAYLVYVVRPRLDADQGQGKNSETEKR